MYTSNNPPVAAPAGRVGQIPDALNNLESAIKRTWSLYGDLKARLEPVSKSEANVPAAGESPKDSVQRVGLALRIDESAKEIFNLASSIEYLLGRIEL